MNAPMTEPRALRCRFEKTGPIRFISHLDLTRAFHRAFSRAGIPLKFSEGFSPHPKFSFALPLSVGTESLAELADFTLKAGYEASPDAIREALQAQMPAGIRILSIEEQGRKFSDIAYAEYRVSLPKADPALCPALQEALTGEVIVKKKNKKGKWVEKDISQGIFKIHFAEEQGGVGISACLSASGENYLKPETVLEALADKLPAFDCSEKRVLRIKVLRSDLTPF